MKKIFIVLLVIIFNCWHSLSAQKFSMFPLDPDTPFDPYFIETRDTFSTRGPHSITRSMLQDKNGNYWLASWQGIIRYDGKQFTNFTLKEDLIHFHVFTAFEDKSGVLWFGTVRGGLYRYDPAVAGKGGKPFTLFTTKDGLADNSVLCMAEDSAGNIWFGTDAGVSRYNKLSASAEQGKIFTNFKTQEEPRKNEVRSIIQDKTGTLWFGGGGGISRYDGKTFTAFKNKEGLPFEKVTSLLEDKKGNIWIGRMEGGGLCRYDPSVSPGAGGNSFTDFMPNFIGYITEDKHGSLWFSLSERNTHYSVAKLEYNQVLYRYNGKTFTKIVEKYDPGDSQVFDIIEDKSGNIWFCTMKGVGRLDAARVDHPCINKSCGHDLSIPQALGEHNRELLTSFTYFAE